VNLATPLACFHNKHNVIDSLGSDFDFMLLEQTDIALYYDNFGILIF